LRSLRKLEEMQIRTEHAELVKEKADIGKLLGDETLQWKTVQWQITELRKKFPPHSPLGKRRTKFAEAPETAAEDLTEAMIEREPITVVLSQKGWVRALKGHQEDVSSLQFKGDDGLKLSFFAETVSKLLVLASNGRVHTVDASKLPGGRGYGEPIRILTEIEEGADVVALFPYEAGAKILVASSAGNGFVAPQDEMIGTTRKGKALLNVSDKETAVICVPAVGDHAAVIGENRKLIVFPLDQVPEMARGKGVRLQRYKDGGIADAKIFAMADGLTWVDSAGRNFTVAKADLAEWMGNRADAGRLPPKGFPKNNKFG